MLDSNKILKKLVDIEAVLKPGVGDKCKRSIVTNAPAPFGNALKRIFSDFSLKYSKDVDFFSKSRLALKTFDMNLIYCDQKNSKKEEVVLVADAPVTQAQYLSVMKGISRPTKKQLSELFSDYPGAKKPAYNMSFIDALKYCNRLSKMLGLDECYKIFDLTSEEAKVNRGNEEYDDEEYDDEEYDDEEYDDEDYDCEGDEGYLHIFVLLNTQASGYRLPTLETWLYCANANQELVDEKFYSGAKKSKDVFDYAWLGFNSEKKLHNIRGKRSNKAGFYDMTGNVYEYIEKIYVQEGSTDPDDPKLAPEVLKFLEENPEYVFLGREAMPEYYVRAIAVGGDFLSPTTEARLSTAKKVIYSYLYSDCLNSNRLSEYSIPDFDDEEGYYCVVADYSEDEEKEAEYFEENGYPRIDKLYEDAREHFVFTGFRLSLVLKAKGDLK